VRRFVPGVANAARLAHNVYRRRQHGSRRDPMIPGGRVNPRQMKQMMKRLGIEQEDLGEVEEVIIRTSDKEYVFRKVPVSAVTAQGQRLWQIVGEPIVRPRTDVAKKPEGAAALSIPEEDVKLVAEKAGVSEDEARKALEEAGGEPAEAIIHLMSR
jgi:nascent polypeptide-associated complex subunit alpha